MRHTLPIAPQFYVTAPQPCPYLANRIERKLFTGLQGDQANLLNSALSKQGFRRSQNVLYRPSCADCSACMSARIRVADFQPSRTQRRTLNRNIDLKRNANPPWATEDQYELFRRYLDSRHSEGGMTDMDIFEFAAMIEETPVKSHVIEYSRRDGGENDLTAVCLTDVLDDGVSLVYSFFDPDQSRRSLGTYVILDHIEIARQMGRPYVYLGYWVPSSAKMAYKAKFSPLEIFKGGRWQDIGDPNSHDSAMHPLSTEPVAEQVAKLTLPDIMAPFD
ncbi:arginyltransferase [Palleronia caenipelagi]|uniref:Aspartate/glutamate leucyltransferase n=1 Tax=Palleronia caenipelagi TaxID=2489174 RepID=A0A547PXL6_9RHOB|nr:arginyltransferase [Palleronia caenipelagi]TRD18897.1 arginyltransferase [Palleronia caenipelagi]